VEKPRYRVVVADDYPETAKIACMLLTHLGHDCRAASTGAEALALIAASVPHLAILDIGMPDITGYELARQLRDAHGTAIYLVAMTGWGQPDDQARAIDAGFDRFLLKPIDAVSISNLIQSVDARR
jgi:CheY-like chemotaxis protein